MNELTIGILTDEGEEEYMAEGLLDASAMLGCVGGVSSSGVGGGGGGGGGGQKTKRLRTSFKHHQLRMLKSYFATNHNPDAKDLKQLSQKTTLSKRVLQVTNPPLLITN